jgi:nucleoid-associated protein YgaU
MGLFDFVKNAGKALFGSDEANAAEAIAKEVGDPSLADKLNVEIDGENVKISGDVPSQEMREKIIVAAGNVEGISKVEENLTTNGTDAEGTFHTVEKRDTLWAIAQKSYGDGAKYKLIFEANRPMLSHPDKIYPGQVLRIPPLDTAQSAKSTS